MSVFARLYIVAYISEECTVEKRWKYLNVIQKANQIYITYWLTIIMIIMAISYLERINECLFWRIMNFDANYIDYMVRIYLFFKRCGNVFLLYVKHRSVRIQTHYIFANSDHHKDTRVKDGYLLSNFKAQVAHYSRLCSE